MPYMKLPGAKLVVGPHGQLEETLGACCSSCARGGPCASAGFDFDKQKWNIAAVAIAAGAWWWLRNRSNKR